MTAQPLMDFEQATVDAERAKCDAQRAAERHAHEAKQARRTMERLAREKRNAEEQIAKDSRRWKRETASKARNDILIAECGINWYSRRRDAGIYWTHCRTCGQLLNYTDNPATPPTHCPGRPAS